MSHGTGVYRVSAGSPPLFDERGGVTSHEQVMEEHRRLGWHTADSVLARTPGFVRYGSMTDDNGAAPFSHVARFDRDTKSITQRRGVDYGHPCADFGRIARLKDALPPFKDARLRHIAEMFCVKLARLSVSPDHLDSIVDIAGYARTWAMVLDGEAVNT